MWGGGGERGGRGILPEPVLAGVGRGAPCLIGERRRAGGEGGGAEGDGRRPGMDEVVCVGDACRGGPGVPELKEGEIQELKEVLKTK